MSDDGLLSELTAEDKALDAEITAPAEPVKTEPVVETKEAEPAKADEPKVVPIQALDEARHKYREVADRLAQEAEKRAKMEARFDEVMKRFNKPAPEAPEYEKDPLGHLKHRDAETQAKLAEFEKWKAEQATQSETQAKEQEFVGKYQALAADYTKTNKDFPAAYTYVRESWASELSALGYAPHEVAQQLNGWERGIAQKAIADGANPAERLMTVAKARGFKPAAAAATQQLATLKKGAEAAKSLSNAGGDVEPPMTLEALAEMEGAEFDKMFDKIVFAGRKNTIM